MLFNIHQAPALQSFVQRSHLWIRMKVTHLLGNYLRAGSSNSSHSGILNLEPKPLFLLEYERWWLIQLSHNSRIVQKKTQIGVTSFMNDPI